MKKLTVLATALVNLMTIPLSAHGASKVGIYKISPTQQLYLVVMIDQYADAIRSSLNQNPEATPLWSCETQTLSCDGRTEAVPVCSQYAGADAKRIFGSGTLPPLAQLTCETLSELR